MELGFPAVANYVPGHLSNCRIPPSLIDRWQHYDPAALEDVRFEAVGPRIKANRIAGPAHALTDPACCICLENYFTKMGLGETGRWKVACGHVFHAHCIERWVNGIEPSSPLCPLCRTPIYWPRERRPIIPSPAGSGYDQSVHGPHRAGGNATSNGSTYDSSSAPAPRNQYGEDTATLTESAT